MITLYSVGTSSSLLSLCAYVYNGEPNVCANASNISTFAWSIKILIALITDRFRPFGQRRRPWMIAGWLIALLLLLFLAISASTLTASAWLGTLTAIQFCSVLSDVPADGYSVQLGKLEPPEKRGNILATGQMIRFIFSMLAGLIQALLLNSPATSKPG